jgi:hypothetical protein
MTCNRRSFRSRHNDRGFYNWAWVESKLAARSLPRQQSPPSRREPGRSTSFGFAARAFSKPADEIRGVSLWSILARDAAMRSMV